MVFNVTFNNISVISWGSVLLVEETEYQEKTTNLPQVTDKRHILGKGCIYEGVQYVIIKNVVEMNSILLITGVTAYINLQEMSMV
jgi:hypothetical protein